MTVSREKEPTEGPRTRQTKRGKEEQRILTMKLFKHGCTPNAICSALKIEQRKLSHHISDTALSPEGMPIRNEGRFIVSKEELPQSLSRFLAPEEEESLVVFEIDGEKEKEGIFRIINREQLKAEIF